MMKEYCGWMKVKKKNCLRILAVMLSLCVMVTTNPDVWSALSVFAAEGAEEDVSGSIGEESKEGGSTDGASDDGSGAGGSDDTTGGTDDGNGAGGSGNTADGTDDESEAGESGDTIGGTDDGNEAGGSSNTADGTDDGSEAGGSDDTAGGSDDGNGAGGNGNTAGGSDNGSGTGGSGDTTGGTDDGSNAGGSGDTAGEGAGDGLEDTEPDETTDVDDADSEDTALLPEGGSFDEDSDINDEDDTVIQELLARIAALPEAEEILANEPEEEDEEAHEEWTAALSMYGEEAFAILEAYEELTEEQQAQIPEEAVAKLMAWAELVEVVTGGQETYAIGGDTGFCGGEGYEKKVTWEHSKIPPKLTIGGEGPMADYDDGLDAPWAGISGAEVNSLIIGEKITHIGKNAFAMVRWNCNSLTIPASVSSIGDNACPKYESITMKGTDTIPELGVGCFKSDCTIWIPNCGYYDAYCSVPGWAAYKENIKKIHTGGGTEYIRAKEPTCVEEGNKEYWRCDACGDLFADSEKKTATTLEAVILSTNDNHSYTYTASGAVITESCANGCGHSATATLSIKSGANQTYTGSEIKPVTVIYGNGWAGTGVNKPNEAQIVYANNINAGNAATAGLTIAGQTANLTFAVTPRDISDAAVTLSGTSLTYNGSEQTQGVSTVTVNGKTLTAGTDYAVSGNKGTDAKTYTMTLTGKGNYTGTETADFTIAPKALSASMITVAAGPHYYTGNAIMPGVAVKDDSRTLVKNMDYTVGYENNTSAGKGTVKVEGKGNYTGTVSQTFTIQYSPLPADKKTHGLCYCQSRACGRLVPSGNHSQPQKRLRCG